MNLLSKQNLETSILKRITGPAVSFFKFFIFGDFDVLVVEFLYKG